MKFYANSEREHVLMGVVGGMVLSPAVYFLAVAVFTAITR